MGVYSRGRLWCRTTTLPTHLRCAYNDLNQLTHIVGPGTNLTLLYDGQSDRLRSYERGTPTWALRNEAQDLAGGLSALVSDGTADYAYLSPGDGSAPLSSYTPGTARATYLGTDITQRVPGSVRLATDPAGATIGAGAYDAWGNAPLPAPHQDARGCGRCGKAARVGGRWR